MHLMGGKLLLNLIFLHILVFKAGIWLICALEQYDKKRITARRTMLLLVIYFYMEMENIIWEMEYKRKSINPD